MAARSQIAKRERGTFAAFPSYFSASPRSDLRFTALPPAAVLPDKRKTIGFCYIFRRCFLRAMATASVRFAAPSLAKSFSMWVFTLSALMFS